MSSSDNWAHNLATKEALERKKTREQMPDKGIVHKIVKLSDRKTTIMLSKKRFSALLKKFKTMDGIKGHLDQKCGFKTH